MFGLGKKKKKDKESGKNQPEKKEEKKPTDSKNSDSTDDKTDPASSLKKKKKSKKTISKKLVFIIFLVLIAVGASGFIVYSMYFATNDPLDPKVRYKPVELEHINLPEEMMEFTFTYFRELYISMTNFNKEINLLNREIERIKSIAKKYPDQIKIADKEKKVWEKVKNTLQKNIIKIEKPIKKLYVLFSVNPEAGIEQIEAKKSELSDFAANALKSANEKTMKLKTEDKVPEGLIKGTIYQIKKKFL